ncbi:MAG: hypothetical protein JSU00_19585 [Acidobacteria bacterium]|nr:hypothetical protein [Acidobacteriota bacterium]
MKNRLVAKRRDFLKTVALAAGAGTAEAQAPSAPAKPASAEPPPAAPAPQAPAAIQYPRTFSGHRLSMIAFPLGGVAAGTVSLGGRGQLRDWEIFNRPDKGHSVSYAFPSIWVQSGAAKPVARVLESRMMVPYQNGFGLSPNQVSGLTRLEDASFTGEYPLARIDFRDRDLPVKVSLEAFTPIIPLDAEESGLPIAILRYTVANPGKETAKVSIAFSMENPAGLDIRNSGARQPILNQRTSEYRAEGDLAGLLMTNPGTPKDDPLAGSFVVGVIGGEGGHITHLRGWPKAKWWASPLLFWDDFTADGQLGPEPAELGPVGSVCLGREIAPGAKAEYTFVLAWHFPNRTPAWCGWSSTHEAERNTVIGNHYSTRFADAWAAASHAASNLPSLEKRMRTFLRAMRESTLPAAMKDAAMANLSTLATPVVFRTADGKFRGFEGISDGSGCCHGNCTHVWNYETTTQHVFPTLARSMREAAFDLAQQMDGVLPIRLNLPESDQNSGTTAADGTMGQVIKAYIDFELSGDSDWLGKIWPKVKHAMEFCWVEGGWDGDRDGVMEGVQHNTYDVEFYGPNPMCGVYYLGALRAAEEMARAVGDAAFAAQCRKLFSSGSQWIDANLFNGEHYVQHIHGLPVDKIAKPLRSRGGAEDPEHPDFQLGEGCLTDQLIGQYLADVAGLGPLLKPENIRKTIATIYKYNNRSSLVHHDSVERIYALNDEAAVLICDYAEGKRPRIPFPYSSEAWTGIEYLFATQLLFAGMLKEGVGAYENVRKRYDGERRNPWDEVECGHHYARAMSAWSGVVALSGFRYQGADRKVIAVPRTRGGNCASFWSTATGWGTFTVSGGRLALTVLAGKLPCLAFELAAEARPAKSSVTAAGKPVTHQVSYQNRRATITLAEAIELAEGDKLSVAL